MDPANRFDAVVLDLGGVIIPLHRERAEAAFRALRPEGFDAAYAALRAEGFLDAFETGHVDTADFLARFTAWSGRDADAVTAAWHAILEPIPAANLRTLEALARERPLYLLSNTNALHMGWIDAHLARDHGLPLFGGLFRHRFLSYEMGLRKPDAAIYRAVTDAAGLDPERVLFVDDDPANAASAEGAGWTVRRHPHNAPLAHSVADLLP